MQNQWTFIGECINVTTKPAGRSNITTAILRREEGDGEKAREVLAAIDIWNARGPVVGDVVIASGSVTTREYNGKYYTSLRCERWHKIALVDQRQSAAPRVPEAIQSHVEAKINGYQPQQESAQGDDLNIPF